MDRTSQSYRWLVCDLNTGESLTIASSLDTAAVCLTLDDTLRTVQWRLQSIVGTLPLAILYYDRRSYGTVLLASLAAADLNPRSAISLSLAIQRELLVYEIRRAVAERCEEADWAAEGDDSRSPGSDHSRDSGDGSQLSKAFDAEKGGA